ncbi:uncharacterized protein A1O5_08192 [Cladophialophora psammophila CBS 110553]|uniref:3-oxoacyl-[acyl-carrier protein] reductase n=1 Tax=Cladophialophora psammophila CBS 110553 TaxID=1182543 RepID=W9WTR3_9EURO|nr:uncharacterized protein A1O5_08192 [Cladophialophora psammophila CBS 110553]EXJ68400.1 hypothetical protein A1O5_08192 [Cladophialophora psammophila CBS 110553]
MLRFDNKVVFITGVGSSGSGIGNGRASAILFARQGATIYGVDLNLSAAEDTRSYILSESPQLADHITVSQCDVTSAADVDREVEKCVEKYGRIDVLVNNVGLSAPGTAENMPEDVWDRQMAVNVKSVFLCCKAVIRTMLEQDFPGGAIVNLSSIAGTRHLGTDHIAYASSKAAIIQFSKSTAIAYASKNIRVNTVVPGLMNTPLVQSRLLKHLPEGVTAEELARRRDSQVPVGRMGDAWDVAYAVIYLASSEAKYVTGSEVVVDGGISCWTARPARL